MVEQVEKLNHRIDLIEVFGHREARDLRLEGLEPRRADGQIDALALDLRGLGDGAFDLAEGRVAIAEPAPRALSIACGSALALRAVCACARRARTNWIAGTLPWRAISNSLRINARSRSMCGTLSPTWSLTMRAASSSSSSSRDGRPRGRPAGLPDWPGGNWVSFGPGVTDSVIARRGLLGLLGAHGGPPYCRWRRSL
jgi:hypothetical protein